MNKIAVIEGDGIGPEVVRETLKAASVLVKKYKLPLTFEKFPYGAHYYLDKGISIPGSVFQEWPRKYRAVLLGALGDPAVGSLEYARDILMGFRFKLDLYVNFRPVILINKKYCPLKQVSRESQVNFVVFRENTEDIYANVGGHLKKDSPDEVAMETSIHTYKGVERIIGAAFEYARDHGKPSLVMGDKSNAMPYVGDLWQRIFSKTGERFPDIEKRHMFIDALCMDIINNPSSYDVIVTSNMFGDILTDVAAQVQGGMGLAASANYNAADRNFLGMYEPVHGSAPDIAGKNISNPIASILSFHLMLQRMGFSREAEVLYRAVEKALEEGKVTPDLEGTCSTTEVGDFICTCIEEAE